MLKVLIFLVLSFVLAFTACPQSGPSTAWKSSWNVAGGVVSIPAGTTYLLSSSPGVLLKSVTVSGELIIDDKDIDLDVEWIRVNDGGKLTIGSTDCPITKKVVITFHGTRPSSPTSPIGSDPADGTDLGGKGLAVATGGSIQMHGALASKSWTRLSSTAYPGATTITLEDAPGWSVGDRIVIANTDFHGHTYDNAYFNANPSIKWMGGWPGFPFQTENVTITAITGNSVTFDPALEYMHWGAGEEKAEVGLLTRHIVLQGDDESETDGFGGHMMLRRGPHLQISGVEFTRMGQRGVKARYPIHYHLVSDVSGQDVYANSNSIHDCFQRCFVIHESHGVTCKDNVAFHTFGHCFFLEDGAERYNVIEGNLGIDPLPVSSENNQQIIPSDNQVSVYWITNPDNKIVNNVAVGGKFGFWFILPETPTGLADPLYDDDDLFIRPRWTPLREFSGNVAHSCADSGFEIDNFMDALGNPNQGGGYDPREGPFDKSNKARDYKWVMPHFKDLVAYKNREFGVWGKSNMLMSGLKLLDNRVGLMVNGDRTMIRDSLFVGETDNIGFPLERFDHARSFPRSYTNETHIFGHQPYDNGGPQYSVNNKFVNFVSRPERGAGGLGALHNGPFILDTRNKYWGLTFENANHVYLHQSTRDADYGINTMDLDGSVTGKNIPSWVVSDENPPMLTPDCERRTDWNAWICPIFREGYAQVTFFGRPLPTETYNGNKWSKYGVPRWARAEWYRTDLPGQVYEGQGWETSNKWQDMTNIIPGHIWGIKWLQSPYDSNDDSPSKLDIRLSSALPGDWVVFALPYPSGTTFEMVQTRYSGDPDAKTFTSVNTFADLEPYKYFYHSGSQHVYLVFRNTRTGYSTYYDYTDYDNYGDLIKITATCPGGKCTQPSSYAQDFPVLSFLNVDRYTTDLLPCEAPGSSETMEGRVWLELDKDTKELTYRIYHGLTTRATDAYFAYGPKDQLTRISTLPLPPPTSPVAGIVTLSSDQWAQLAAGNMFVVVTTTENPNGALLGKLGCEGTCSAPEARPQIDNPCPSPSTTTLPLFDEDFDPRFEGRCYECQSELTKFDGGLCGTALKTSGYESWHRMVFAAKWTKEHGNKLPIDPSLYEFLEFYIRLKDGDGRVENTRVGLDVVEADTEYVNTKDHADYIENYIVDDTRWTRVRIPLTQHFTYWTGTTLTLQAVYISIDAYNDVTREFWVDQARFIGSAPDTMRTFGNPSPYVRPVVECPTVPGSPADVSPLFAVSPIKECVAETDSGYLIHFGHQSDEPQGVNIEIGEHNHFSPGSENRGQPSFFTPGRSQYWPMSEFTVAWDGASSLTWNLNGFPLITSPPEITTRACPTSLTVDAKVDTTAPAGLPDIYKRGVEQAPTLSGYDGFLDRTSNCLNSGGTDSRLYHIYFTISDDAMKLGIVCQTETDEDYCAFAFSPEGIMPGSSAIVGYSKGVGAPVQVEQFYLGGKRSPNKEKCNNGDTALVCPDSEKPGCCNHVQFVAGERVAGYMSFEVIVPLTKEDDCDGSVSLNADQNIIYSIGTPTSTIDFPLNLKFHHHWTFNRPDTVQFHVNQTGISKPTCTPNNPFPTPPTEAPPQAYLDLPERLVKLAEHIALMTGISKDRVSVTSTSKRGVEQVYDVVLTISGGAAGTKSSGDAFVDWIDYVETPDSEIDTYLASQLQWVSYELQPTGVEEELSHNDAPISIVSLPFILLTLFVTLMIIM